MGAPQTVPPIQLGIPIRGYNVLDPLAKMPIDSATWALNMEPETQFMKVRGGWQIHATLSDEDSVLALGNYQDQELFAYAESSTANNRIYDVTSSGSQAAGAALVTTGGTLSTEAFQTHFSGLLGFIVDTWGNEARTYNGTTWSAWAFTIGGLSRCGFSQTAYKGRVYFINSGKVYYSTLAAVAGAMTEWDTTSLFDLDKFPWFIRQLRSPTNTADQQLLVVGNRGGEILVYAGDNPGATNWEQVAKFKTSKPLHMNAAIEVHNDVWIATSNGVVSVRQLFIHGSSDMRKISPSAAINDYWTNLSHSAARTSMAHWPEKNKLYIMTRNSLSQDYATTATDETTIFVYNFLSGGWTVHQLGAITTSETCLTYFNDALYCAIDNLVMKYVPTSYKDEQVDNAGNYQAISYALHSAYTNLNNANKHKDIVGVEPLIKTDFDGDSFTVKTASDFGRKVSAAQSHALLDGYQNHFYGAGVRGEYVQYRIEGDTDTTSTDGLEIYSVGVCVK